MKKIILILIIFNLFYINKVKAEEKEYIFTMSLSSVLYVREVREFYNVGDIGDIKTIFDEEVKVEKPLFFTKQECIDYTKKEILNCYNINYISGGLFIDTAFGGYGRYFCVKYKDVEKYIKRNDFINFEEFNKGENKNMPLFVDEKTIPEVYNSLFPLDKDQKEAVKITKKFDKEIKKLLKKKRESNIKDYYK